MRTTLHWAKLLDEDAQHFGIMFTGRSSYTRAVIKAESARLTVCSTTWP